MTPVDGAVRLAGPADLDAVMALCAAWPGLPPWTRRHFEEELSGPRSQFYVFEGREPGGTRVIGCAGLRLVPPEAEVTTVAVQPDRARRGVGRRLLERLIREARDAGCALLGLEVSERNSAARALYERAGLRVVGRRRKYYNDGSDALLMSLRL